MKKNRFDGSERAFTLIELLASMAILGLLVVMLFAVFQQTSKAWLQGETHVETLTQSRAVLDLMSRELSQAIAMPKIPFSIQNNHHMYFVAPLSTAPTNRSDLVEVGYEYERGSSPNWAFQITRRLIQPNSGNLISGKWNPYALSPPWWSSFFNMPILSPPEESALLTSNSVLNVEFQYWNGSAFVSAPAYDSTANGNKLPVAVQIIMDVVDFRTATKLRLVPLITGKEWIPLTNSTLRSISTVVYLPNALP